VEGKTLVYIVYTVQPDHWITHREHHC